MSLKTRMKALKTYIWSVLTYGCETWTLTKEARDKLEAFEMWTLRRMLRIPWTARRTNEQVLQQAQTNRVLLKQIKKRQLKFLGHSARKHQIERLSITGTIEGTKPRGRPRYMYVDRIIECNDLQCRPSQLIQWTDDRQRWRGIIAHVT